MSHDYQTSVRIHDGLKDNAVRAEVYETMRDILGGQDLFDVEYEAITNNGTKQKPSRAKMIMDELGKEPLK